MNKALSLCSSSFIQGSRPSVYLLFYDMHAVLIGYSCKKSSRSSNAFFHLFALDKAFLAKLRHFVENIFCNRCVFLIHFKYIIYSALYMLRNELTSLVLHAKVILAFLYFFETLEEFHGKVGHSPGR